MPHSIRRYQVTHKTHYEYSIESSLCHNQTHLRPRELPYQRVHSSVIEIVPKPALRQAWTDVFGNQAEFYSIEEVHSRMTVTATSLVDRMAPPDPTNQSGTWAEVMNFIENEREPSSRKAREFTFDSKHCQRDPEFYQFAREIVDTNRNFIECIKALTSKIFFQFKYSPSSTHVSTKPIEAFEKRQGVCQDFAHIQICCLRALGIPTRYVSGYLLTHPAPGKEKLIGADASHAWVSVFAGPLGWIDFDPTNNKIPDREHITVAWGRDYADVAPIQGVFVGGGGAILTVSVDVSPA